MDMAKWENSKQREITVNLPEWCIMSLSDQADIMGISLDTYVYEILKDAAQETKVC